MQERTSLEDALSGIGKVERELADNIEHDRARRGRERRRRRHGSRGRAQGSQEGGGAPRAGGAAVGRGRRQRRLSRGPCRRRRHRKPGLGADAAAHVHPLGQGPRLQGRVSRGDRGRTGRHQVGDPADHGPQRLWLAEDRGRRAPPGAHLAVRLQRAAAHQLRLGAGLSRWSTTPSRSTSTPPTCAPTPMRSAAPAASTSTRPTRPCA